MLARPGINTYLQATDTEPHQQRARRLLAQHPELRQLAKPLRLTALVGIALVVLQLGIAVLLRDSSVLMALAAAFVVGAFVTHALWMVIHEAGHSVVFSSKTLNRVTAIIANLPMVIPSGITFGRYHHVHHTSRGAIGEDTDLAEAWEARLAGRRPLGKLAWQTIFTLAQALRTRRSALPFLDGWTIANIVIGFGFDGVLLYACGPMPLVYLLASLIFSVGPHPLGGRWIQEHFVVKEGQETYSYYGPLNAIALNAGYHVEHHDMPGVPWLYLPKVSATAPEMYRDLHAHRSWTKLWVRFLFDRDLTLYSRYTR